MHPLHGNPYSLHWHQLMGIPIACWLAASMWDFLPFCLLHINLHHHIIYHHSAMSMACAHVLRKSWKSWSALKSMNKLLGLSSGLCMMGAFCVMKWSMAKLYDFVGISLRWPCCFEKTWLLYWYAQSIIVFMSNDRLLLWITRALIFMPWLDIWSRLC